MGGSSASGGRAHLRRDRAVPDLFRHGGTLAHTRAVLPPARDRHARWCSACVGPRERGRTGNVPCTTRRGDHRLRRVGLTCDPYASLSELTSKQPGGTSRPPALIVLFLEGLRRKLPARRFSTPPSFHRARDVRGSPAPGSSPALDTAAALAITWWWDSSAISASDQVYRDCRGGIRFFSASAPQGGRLDLFTGIAMALMGKYRGGAARSRIVGSSCSIDLRQHRLERHDGGTVTIPLMKRAGFRPPSRRAIEALRLDGAARSRLPSWGSRPSSWPSFSRCLSTKSPGCGHTRAPFLCRASSSSGPGGGAQQILRAKEEIPRSAGSQGGLVFPAALVALVYALFGLNTNRRWLGWWRPRSCSFSGLSSVPGQAHRLFASQRCCATGNLGARSLHARAPRPGS